MVPPPLLLLCQLHVFTEQPHIRLSNVQTTMAKRLAHRGGSQKSIFGKDLVIISYHYHDGKFGDNLQKINFRPTTAFVVTKKAILGYQGHKAAWQASEWAPTRKPKVSRVTLGCGEVMIPLSRIHWSPKIGYYMGVAEKNANFWAKNGLKI